MTLTEYFGSTVDTRKCTSKGGPAASPARQQPSSGVLQSHSNPAESCVGVRLAKDSVEALYESYVKQLGGNWTRFFDRLYESFMESGYPDEIDKAFDKYKVMVPRIEKRFRKLQEVAIMASDYAAMEEGRGMVERVKEVGEKIHEFYAASVHGSEEFKDQVESGMISW